MFRDAFETLKRNSSYIKTKDFFPDYLTRCYDRKTLEYNGKDISNDFLVHCLIGCGFYIDEKINELKEQLGVKNTY